MRFRTAMTACGLALSLALSGTAPPAWAGKSDDTLRIGWGATGPIDNLDAYFNTNRTGLWLAQLVWDTLIFRDPKDGSYKPLLATSWKQVDELTMDFALREGVTFHNGEPFDADDVVHTLNFVANPANGVKTQSNINWIERAEKTGTHSVRLRMKRAMPQILELLSGPLVIYPNEYYAKSGPEGMNRMPVGTGPYRVTGITPTQRYRLERYDGYRWGSPKGVPAIKAIDIREIADVQTQVAELLSGGIDFTADITADQLKQIKRMPRLDGVEAETMRISYLGFDVAGRSGFAPVQNPKVRQAVAHAIDRETLARVLVGGDSKVIDTPCFPTQFGCDASAAVRWNYDPSKAKALLAEAGFGSGLKIDLYNYRSPSWAEAIIGDLAKVGITANLNQMGYFALRDLQHKSGRTPMYLMDWGSLSINDMSAITSKFFTHGPDDLAMDPELKVWLEAGDNASDPAVRQTNYRKAIERITSRLYWFPMFSHVRSYAYVKELNFTGYVDEIPRFYAYSWK